MNLNLLDFIILGCFKHFEGGLGSGHFSGDIQEEGGSAACIGAVGNGLCWSLGIWKKLCDNYPTSDPHR